MEYSRGTVFWTCGRILACATTLNRDVALKVCRIPSRTIPIASPAPSEKRRSFHEAATAATSL